jgi:hypothetical protein
MQVLPDYNKPYIIDSLTAPVVIKHNWIFNAVLCDFMLNAITYLEETTGGAVKVRINGAEFWVPSSWYILVTDAETYQIDTVSIQDCAKKRHIAFGFSPDESNLHTLEVQIIDAVSDENPISLVHPMISKGTALVHPVGPAENRFIMERRKIANGGETETSIRLGASRLQEKHLSVVIGPHDLYKYLTSKVVGDIFSY